MCSDLFYYFTCFKCCLYFRFDRFFCKRIRGKCFWCNNNENIIWFNRYPEDWNKYYNTMMCMNCYENRKLKKIKQDILLSF